MGETLGILGHRLKNHARTAEKQPPAPRSQASAKPTQRTLSWKNYSLENCENKSLFKSQAAVFSYSSRNNIDISNLCLGGAVSIHY